MHVNPAFLLSLYIIYNLVDLASRKQLIIRSIMGAYNILSGRANMVYLFILSVVVFVISVHYIFGVLNIISDYSGRRRRTNGTKNEQVPSLPAPPGSTGWPMIGETLEYLRTAKNGVPEKFISDRRDKYSSKVFKTSLLREHTALLCSAAGNKFLFSNENKLVKSWWPANFDKIFANSEKSSISQQAGQVRKLLSPHLKPDGLQKYIGMMDSVTKQHLDTFWDHKDEVKVLPLAKNFTLTMICRLFLNIEDPQVVAKLAEPIQHISSGFIAVPIDVPGTRFNRAIRASRQVRKEIEDMVVRRKIQLHDQIKMSSSSSSSGHSKAAYAHEDIMSNLLLETYSDDQEMKESDIANKLYGLIIGAFVSISTTLVTIVMCLAQFPQVYDAVLKEQMEIANSKAAGELLNWGDVQKMKYSWSVACEVLRLLPPVMGTFREAITDFVYEGYLIPKGMKLHWNVFATHKNPEYFPDPEKFEPSRFEGAGPAPYSYVPFGGGPRMCPGKEFARFEILVFMHNVVTRYKWDKVFPDEKMVRDPVLLPTKGLPIRLYPHHHNV